MDSGYIVITAQKTEATSDAFEMVGEGKIIASGLANDSSEYVKLYEEFPDGVYRPALDDKGISVTLNYNKPSYNVVGYGSYKLYKTVTTSDSAVAYIS